MGSLRFHRMTPEISITLGSDTETTALGQMIAPRLVPGDVILLEGPIGAGKTHFVRSVVQARLSAVGRNEDVPSPTFTLVQTYDAGDAELWHADLYRLSDPGEVLELGLDEAFETAICFVEWPDRLGEAAPPGAIRIALNQGRHDDERVLTVLEGQDRWQQLTEATSNEVSA